MKNKVYIILAITLGLFTSCSDSIMDEIDRNPNVFSDAPLNTLLPNVTARYMVQVVGGGTARTTQFLSEQTTYVLGESVLEGLSGNGTTAWNNGYLMLNDLKIIMEEGETNEAWAYVGIAGVFRAMVLSNLVDIFGSIPLSEALRLEIENPRFDREEDIYQEIQRGLDEAISDLQRSPGNLIPTNDDMIFNGNREMWIKTAYGLKARLYNRLSNLDPQGSANSALQALSNSYQNDSEWFGFTKYQNTLNNGNPFSISQNSQPMSSVGNGIFNAMLSFTANNHIEEDPRADIWFTRVNGELLPAPNGTARSDFQEPRLDGAFYSKPEIFKHFSAPQPVLTFTELKFIEAEAKLRLEDRQGAYAAYEIALNMALNEASLYNSERELTEEQKNAYLSLPKVLPGVNNLTERDIIYQKYIYFFQYQPIEAYNEFRRTGLFPVTDPRGSATRIPYPISELTRNQNTPTEINDFTILESGTKLFWAK